MALRYDLLAVDLDGTLLGPDGRVSDANARAVARARDAGLTILPATGRGLVESGRVLRAIDHDGAVVVAGGAVTAEARSGKTIDRAVMPDWLVRDAVEHIHGHGHVAAVLKDADAAGYDYLVVRGEGRAEADPVLKWWFEMTGVSVRTVDRLEDDDCPELTVRVGCTAVDDEAEPLTVTLQRELGERALLHRFTTVAAPATLSNRDDGERQRRVHVVEVFDTRAGKWGAIGRHAGRLGIDLSRVAAIGDETNDVDMLRGAALGIAMGNAVEAAKAVADRVTTTNAEDGLARAIDLILAGEW
jgi:hydroxymethylpyrimidine pyrophosphatase-like HAD family hydrolase